MTQALVLIGLCALAGAFIAGSISAIYDLIHDLVVDAKRSKE